MESLHEAKRSSALSDPRTFLVPTDFSAGAEAALDVALELAAEAHAKVHVMHAIQPPYVGFSDGLALPTADLVARMREQAESDLAACVAKRSGTRIEVVSRIAEGDPRDAVLETADEIDAGLVIMGTRGRRGIARALIGSVAESVVRTCARPVMTVHAPRTVAGPFRHILVPTDLTEASQKALDAALDVARVDGAVVTLLHVWSLPTTGYAEALLWPREGLQRAAQAALDTLLASTRKLHAKTEAILQQGSETTAILDAATKERCDLVVMGTHGRQGLPRLLFGSVAGEIVRLSPTPVLTVRAAQG